MVKGKITIGLGNNFGGNGSECENINTNDNNSYLDFTY